MIFDKHSRNGWRFVACIHYKHLRFIGLDFFVDIFKGSAVMFIPRMNGISQYPAIFIAGGLGDVCKFPLVFSLMEHSGFGIGCTLIDFFLAIAFRFVIIVIIFERFLAVSFSILVDLLEKFCFIVKRLGFCKDLN